MSATISREQALVGVCGVKAALGAFRAVVGEEQGSTRLLSALIVELCQQKGEDTARALVEDTIAFMRKNAAAFSELDGGALSATLVGTDEPPPNYGHDLTGPPGRCKVCGMPIPEIAERRALCKGAAS